MESLQYVPLCLAASAKHDGPTCVSGLRRHGRRASAPFTSVPLSLPSPLCLPASPSGWVKQFQGFHLDVPTPTIRKYRVFCVIFVKVKGCFPEVFKRATSHIS